MRAINQYETREQINYVASPTASKFLQSDAYVKMLMGPVGSGKTVACCWDILMRAMNQRKAPDGIRYSRWVAIRNTYEQLKTTTIRTWQEWTEWSGTSVVYSSPIRHHLRFNDVDLEIWFISFDRPKDVRKLLSLETTGVWLNEARELPRAALEAATQRCGRYPSKLKGHPYWYGVIGDTNPCDDDEWFYESFEKEKPANYELFKYPPGLIETKNGYVLNPEAENLNNLAKDYYINQSAGKSKEWVKVYLMGQYGTVADGIPVYPEFNAQYHVTESITPIENSPLILGFDFGLTPACVITQVSPHGRLLVLGELQAKRSGIKTFAQEVVIPYLNENFPDHLSDITAYADPAGEASDAIDEQMSCIGVLNELGIETESASSNQFSIRRNSVADLLTRMIDGEPAIQIDASCKTIIKGFSGHYRHKRVQVVGEERYKNEPDKNNIYSHLQDALQYVALSLQISLKEDEPVKDFYNHRIQNFWAR